MFGVSANSPGRFIVSDSLPDFRPVFPEDIETNLGDLVENVERVFLSGYHNLEGNRKEVFKKAEEQLEKIRRVN
ncbi:MAG: hypothetical protein ABEJ72_10560, partial [Candidatus Aenigmatarchaeota archaeon]